MNHASQRQYRRTEAAIQALRSGGREEGLLHLHYLWARGATILAGTGVPPTEPVRPRARVALDCPRPACGTTVFADCIVDARDRLAKHRRNCHG